MSIKRSASLAMVCSVTVMLLSGCAELTDKRIVRVAHGQSTSHPDHIGLLEFERYVEENLGDSFDVQIFPNELLGTGAKAMELLQTGAIDYVVASTGNLEAFDGIYRLFNIPYLFSDVESYHAVMNNKEITEPIYSSTEESGFRTVEWLDAGVRNFYAVKPINTPEDLKGKKIRVQQSNTNVRMMELFGAAAAPMSFGEVYTAIQQGVIDGAENNELALTNNKHGEVAKYYSYNQHQMVPDMLVANTRFLDSLTADEKAVFDRAAKLCGEVERDAWEDAAEAAKEQAEKMGVNFLYPDTEPFRQAVLPLHEEILAENEYLRPIYEQISKVNQAVKEENS